MSEDKSINLIKAAKELNIGTGTIVDFLATKGFKVEKQPMAKLNGDMYTALLKEFAFDKSIKEEAKQINIGKIRKDEPEQAKPAEFRRSRDFENEEILIKNAGNYAPQTEKSKAAEPEAKKAEEQHAPATLPGVKVVGSIDLNDLNAKPQFGDKKETPAVKPEATPAPQPEPKKEEIKPEPVAEVKKEVIPEVPKAEALPVVEVPKVEAPKAEAPVVHAPVTPPAAPVASAAPTVIPAAPAAEEPQDDEVIRAKAERLTGPNIIGKIQLPDAQKRNPVASSSNNSADQKRKRKRKDSQGGGNNQHGGGQGGQQNQAPLTPSGPVNPNRPDFRNRGNNPPAGGGGQSGGNSNRPDFRGNRNTTPHSSGPKEEPSEKDIQDQIKATLARLSGAGKSGKFAQRAKFRRQKRDDVAATAEELALEQESQSKVLKATEFVTANELASMMDVPVTQIISTCMSLGMFVSINQRLDAETLAIVADEFGYQIEFVKPQDEEGSLDSLMIRLI